MTTFSNLVFIEFSPKTTITHKTGQKKHENRTYYT